MSEKHDRPRSHYSLSGPMSRKKAKFIAGKLREAGVETTNDGRAYQSPSRVIRSKKFVRQIETLRGLKKGGKLARSDESGSAMGDRPEKPTSKDRNRLILR